jgi:hypothetical protein
MIPARYAAAFWMASAVSPAAAASYDGAPPFEKAADIRTVKLGAAEMASASDKEVRCFYFSRLMVKEIDAGDIGDQQISYILLGPGQTIPDCVEKAIAGERKLPAEESYFWGVAADSLFVIDADGANRTIGFRIYEPQSSRELFHDTIKLDSRLREATMETGKLRLSYTRAVTGYCSVVTDGETCWRAIAGKMQMPETPPPPDCRAGYDAALRRLAEEACKAQSGEKVECLERETKERRTGWDAAPSAVSYDVDVVVGPTDEVVRHFSAGPIACWPSD